MNGIVGTILGKFKNQGVWVSDVKVNVNGMNGKNYLKKN